MPSLSSKVRFCFWGTIIVGAVSLAARPGIAAGEEPELPEVVWTTPGADSRDSMPLGNGDIALNVWTEPNGDLLFYIAKTDAWGPKVPGDKGLLKVGKVRVRVTPSSPFVSQKLVLREGAVEIRSAEGLARVWVDANRPVVRVETQFKSPVKVEAGFESLRPVAADGLAADILFTNTANQVAWCYRNDNRDIPALKDLTFGAVMQGTGMTRAGGTLLKTESARKEGSLAIAVLTAQAPTPADWLRLAEGTARTAGFGDWDAHCAWWREFWNRSWIVADSAAVPIAPTNRYPLAVGKDQKGQSQFKGEMRNVKVPDNLNGCFTLETEVKPATNEGGRLFDKITPGGNDGFLLDARPEGALRLIVGYKKVEAKGVLPAGVWSKVALTADTKGWQVTVNGKPVMSLPLAAALDASHASQMYALQRFVSACAGRGAYPIKFNGSLFTMDLYHPGKVAGVNTNVLYTADRRFWGGMYWFQNTRAMYWPMMASGDFEMMMPLFRMYRGQLAGNAKSVRDFYGHGGAYFAETASFWGGIPNIRPGEEGSYTKHYYLPILELSTMMLDYFDYTGDSAFAREFLLPIAEAGLAFYDGHFPRENGKLLLKDVNAVETFWKARNPAPDIAGLRRVLAGLLALPRELTTPEQRARWSKALAEIPELPLTERKGVRLLAPAEKFGKARNCENPELYAVHPFRLFQLGKSGLDLARASFEARQYRVNGCWRPDGIQAALLGETDAAAKNLLAVFARKDPQCRFPAFWENGSDYVPDEDNGGNALSTFQTMLLQSDGDAIRVLPTWPKNWNARFKLHAPRRTTVECEFRGGKITRLVVTPRSRARDVIIGQGLNKGDAK